MKILWEKNFKSHYTKMLYFAFYEVIVVLNILDKTGENFRIEKF